MRFSITGGLGGLGGETSRFVTRFQKYIRQSRDLFETILTS